MIVRDATDNTAENTARPGPAPHPTVLAIHGVLCDHSVWQPLTPGLHALGWNMAALDLPGHGRIALLLRAMV